jgi:predicted DNA repair protein MutK
MKAQVPLSTFDFLYTVNGVAIRVPPMGGWSNQDIKDHYRRQLGRKLTSLELNAMKARRDMDVQARIRVVAGECLAYRLDAALRGE